MKKKFSDVKFWEALFSDVQVEMEATAPTRKRGCTGMSDHLKAACCCFVEQHWRQVESHHTKYGCFGIFLKYSQFPQKGLYLLLWFYFILKFTI